MMLIHGFRVARISDDAYEVRDTQRTLGGVVRYLKPEDGKGWSKAFRAFGDDFPTLSEAVKEFTKIKSAKPFDEKGDIPG